MSEELLNEPYPGFFAETERRKQEREAAKAYVPPPTKQPLSAMKTSDIFERWAEDYGNLVRMVKEAGKAKISAHAKGISPKTLAARLRDVRAAIVQLDYKSPHIPSDATAIMQDKVFRELGEWVFVEDKRKGSGVAAVVEDPTGPAHPPFVTSSLDDAKAYLCTFEVKDENGMFIFRKLVLAVADPTLYPQVLTLAASHGSVWTDAPWIEITRKGL